MSHRDAAGESPLLRFGRWASGLRLEQIPAPVREQAVNQVLSMLAAVYSGWDSDLGPLLENAFPSPGPGDARILPTGASAPASHAAMAMASWSMVLDFDDVMLGGHTGHSSVLVPLALGSNGSRSGSDLLLAQIVANELAARVNMVCAIGPTRGQMATHLHLLAAAAAKAKLENLDADSFSRALSFALSYPGQALYPAFMGSDAKALCAALPIRTGMEAVDAVMAGLSAAADPLNGRHGFFSRAAYVPVREFLEGLGERWHSATISYKIYPVCGYVCAALDATLSLVEIHDVQAAQVDSVEVRASLFTVGMDHYSAPYLLGPASHISTLTFSTPFTIASAILARQFKPEQLKRDWIEREDVWSLAGRVKVLHDIDLTLTAMTADIPLGAALRRIKRWQAAAFGLNAFARIFGRSSLWKNPEVLRLAIGLAKAAGDCGPLSFHASTKPLGARVTIRMKDGRILKQAVSIPRGFCNALRSNADESNLRHLMKKKFMSAAGAVIGHERATKMMMLVENLESLPPSGIEEIMDLACIPSPILQ